MTGETGPVLLPALIAAPIGCTAVIVGIAAASDPRLRSRGTSPLFSPALVAVGAALALGPAIDSWFSDLSTGWFWLQVVLVLGAVALLVQEGRRAGYGLPSPAPSRPEP